VFSFYHPFKKGLVVKNWRRVLNDGYPGGCIQPSRSSWKILLSCSSFTARLSCHRRRQAAIGHYSQPPEYQDGGIFG
jgi:hypothetical protein